jgi:PPOX class probable FMN-dependent enzyme
VDRIADLEQLRRIVGEPTKLTQSKIYDRLSPQATDFIARSPFLVLSTVDADGMPTASPKGDEPGFVQQTDERTLYMPERRGNRLVVSYQNILDTGRAGLLFLLPQCSETLRVSGHAELVTDERMCAQMSARGNPAILLLKITVTEAYFHCGKALIRSNLWNADAWPEASRVSFGREIGDNIGEGRDFADDLDAQVLERYKDSL